MSLNSTTDPKDRFFGAVVYLVPLLDAFMFGQFLLPKFSIIGVIYVPLQPLLQFYYSFPFAPFIIFIVLFMAVVRNSNISHFIRFNAMQSILMGIMLALFRLILSYVVQPAFGSSLITETFYNFAFLAALAGSLFGIVQSALGQYPQIPTISEAAYNQVRW